VRSEHGITTGPWLAQGDHDKTLFALPLSTVQAQAIKGPPAKPVTPASAATAGATRATPAVPARQGGGASKRQAALLRRSMRASLWASHAVCAAQGPSEGGGAVRGALQRLLLEQLVADQLAGGQHIML
jgi:hypothetical protein